MRTAPVYGGVFDGAIVKIPDNAELGYQEKLTNVGQTTDYTLRDNGEKAPTLVADSLPWPLLDTAPA